MNIHHNSTEKDKNDIDVKFQLEHQIGIQETKENGWIFDRIHSRKIRFYKTSELNGSSQVKIPLRSNVMLNKENNDKFSFLWPTLASLLPCEIDHPNRVSKYGQYFNELKIEGFDFSN